MTLEEIFDRHKNSKCATAGHLETLKGLASQCQSVVEFGVNRAASSAAFLLGCPGVLHSWDLKITKQAKALKRVVGNRWRLYEENILQIKSIPEVDMAFFDSLHVYSQLEFELQFANNARKYLVFHDTISFAVNGADGETGRWIHTPEITPIYNEGIHGIRLAIDEFMVENPQWRIKFHTPHGHGLLCLEREI